MSNDPLSDILRLTEAKSVISGGIMAGGSWALRFPPPGEIKFSVLAKGSCWVRLDGQSKALKAEQGDVALLPGRQGFLVGSNLNAPPRDAVRLMREKRGMFAKIGDATECLILAGGVSMHPTSAAMLTDLLPPIVHIRASNPRTASLRFIVEQLLEEQTSTLAGSAVASSQLAQLLFVQVLRTHLATAGTMRAGWLRAVRDERIAPALRLMHQMPERDWKLTELAKAAAMSRTSFAVHFKAVAGMAPLTYLTEWRMRLAQKTLRESDVSVFEVGTSLGYTSESAFSHAFKRVTGLSPRDYRRAAAQLEATTPFHGASAQALSD